MQKRWLVQPSVTDDTRALFPDYHPLIVQLLINRGLTDPEQFASFLSHSYDEGLHDPFLFRDMQKAVERCIAAVMKNERVILYGDYDCDGVSSVSVLYETFKALGHNDIDVFIPDRYKEGYGLHTEVVERFAAEGAKLLICCDCGTTNVEQVAAAKAKGLDVIICDHHKPAETLPNADALLNPALFEEIYPEKTLCSTGVAYKLASALFQKSEYGAAFGMKPLTPGWEKWLLDLVALATVADMVPLQGENRVLVRHGLSVLRRGRRTGLRALATVMGTPLSRITTHVAAFHIAPRLNAAGRLKHADAAFQLLTTQDQNEAMRLARDLNAVNIERQKLTDAYFHEAIEQVPKENLPLLISAYGETWSSGVIGLIAGKLKEAFQRPALAIANQNGKLIGSGRSVAGFDITNALSRVSDRLEKFGGHAMACGFTLGGLEKLEPFLVSLRAVADEELAEKDLTPELTIDALLQLSQLDWDTLELVEKCAPFGVGSPEPLFATKDVEVAGLERVGQEGKHLRLRVVDAEGNRAHGIGFGKGALGEGLAEGAKVNIAYYLQANEWNGSRRLEIRIADVQPAEG